VTLRLKEVEDALESAAANEEYEEAGDLNEEMQQILLDSGALDLTEEEMDAALVDLPVESTLTTTSGTIDDAKLDDESTLDPHRRPTLLERRTKARLRLGMPAVKM
jgi:hypothetical protein